MTKHLENTFGLPHLDDVLKEDGALPDTTPSEPMFASEEEAQAMVAGMKRKMAEADQFEERDHAEAMDELFQESLRHAQNIMDTGFNIDPARAPRWFEVAGGIYKIALDAKNSKIEAKLKAAQVKLNQQKLELERGQGGDGPTVNTQGMVVEDRNDLILRLREQAKKEK